MLLYTGKIIKHKWENCMTVDKRAWTHRRKIQIEDVMSIEELLAKIAETVRQYIVLSAWSADIDHWENLCILSLLIRELTYQIMKLMCIKYCITITSIEIKDEFLFLFYR